MDDSTLARFMAKVEVVDRGYVTPCWVWTGSLNNAGYGQLYTGRRSAAGHKIPGKAHRLAYEHWNGVIPEAHHPDHLCRQHDCVNPAHLEAVTPRENARRGIKGALTTHCPAGHEYDERNTAITKAGHRLCRACRRERERARRSQLKRYPRTYDPEAGRVRP